jgi:hypothetical protein
MLGTVLQGAIHAYQLVVSPCFPSACRFEPSCSQYGIEAIGRHGPWRGLWLAARRIGRCHPLGGFGPDPVPERIPRGGSRGS